MTLENVVIFDKAPNHHIELEELLRKRKVTLFRASSQEEADELLKLHSIDLVVCNPHFGGFALLKRIKAQQNPSLVLFIADHSSIEEAIEAMQLGAFHYLSKPFTKESIDKILHQADTQIQSLREAPYTTRNKYQLIAESEMMRKLLSDVCKAAKSSSSVLISGESGTGKEVIAQALHAQSPRQSQSFIKVNCAAIPATLLESEFFGHEKGAFTGALQKKMGRFELAHLGTLLLDEISEIPLELQAKLLRAVQEMEFERVGGVSSIQVDVRLISTSNRPMKEAIEQKCFREDLYYRLNVIPIHLPPLRERKEDILPLAEFFLKRLCEENHYPIKRLCIDAKRKLTAYHWPGNIRELANVIERSVIMNPEPTLEAHQIYLDLCCPIKESPSSTLPVGITLKELEKRLILQTLAQEHNNRTKTAQVLDISLRTLRNKLRSYK